MKRPGVDWPGAIALVLALGISCSMIIIVIGTTISDRDFSPSLANVLSTLFGAAVGVVGTYLGAHGRHGARATDRGDRRGAPNGHHEHKDDT